MKANGIPDDVARRIYQQINAFADYGFPESHAASFALIVYASAYLRHYYAPEYLAAMLNSQPMGFYAPGTLIEDAKRHGVIVRPVDLTISGWHHSLEAPRTVGQAPAVRLGLRLVKGLGRVAREALEAARAHGPFTSVSDVVRRTALDQKALRALCEAGAFDAMFAHIPDDARRRHALWEVLAARRGDAGPLAPATPNAVPAPLPAYSPIELTEADYRMTGVSLAGHPMRHLREVLALNDVRTAAQLQRDGRDGERVAHAGLVICRQRPGTAKGFVFLTLEDETGMLNVVVTPARFARQALLISGTPLLLVRGTLQVEKGVVNLRAEQFRALKVGAGEAYARSHDYH
jgi:error-prone DNA polymerase